MVKKVIDLKEYSDENSFGFAMNIDCEYLIDAYEYHDAPSSVTYNPSLNDLLVLQADIETAIKECKQHQQLITDTEAIVARGNDYVCEWLEAHGWKVHKSLQFRKQVNSYEYACSKHNKVLKKFSVPLRRAVWLELYYIMKGQEA